MVSILLSFVGNQDPASEQTNEPGSIVTLIHHLLEENNFISHIILLYTQGTKEAASLTQEWLIEETANLKTERENIQLIPVDKRLSQDPVDLLLAIQAARQALKLTKFYLNPGDFLELNASSGTPAMKSSWNILQAAGYAPQSRVWQVRNPQEMRDNQSRVFEVNVDTLKREFDLKIIRQQVEKYDYNGALITFEASNLTDNGISNLLRCGSCRLTSAFDKSFNQIKNYSKIINEELYTQAKNLAARQHKEIIKEIYFQSNIKAKNKEFSELLVKIFIFQESVLFYLVKEKLLSSQDSNLFDGQNLYKKLKHSLEDKNNSKLKSYLINYRLNNGQKLDLDRDLNRVVMMAILEYFYNKESEIYKLLQELEQYCQQRNEYIHQLKGVDKLEGEEILHKMQKILKILNLNVKSNPFKLLNQQIFDLIASLS